jgi:hypothetical protein
LSSLHASCCFLLLFTCTSHRAQRESTRFAAPAHRSRKQQRFDNGSKTTCIISTVYAAVPRRFKEDLESRVKKRALLP